MMIESLQNLFPQPGLPIGVLSFDRELVLVGRPEGSPSTCSWVRQVPCLQKDKTPIPKFPMSAKKRNPQQTEACSCTIAVGSDKVHT